MELDTEEGYARFTLRAPKKVDFVAIQNAAHAAAYTIKKLEIEIAGEVTKARCDTCKKESLYLKVNSTGQLLEIEGNVQVGHRGRLRASADDWGKDVFGFFTPKKHVVLKVEDFRP